MAGRTNSKKETRTRAETADLRKTATTEPMMEPVTPAEDDVSWIKNVMESDSLENLSSPESMARMLKFTLNTLFQTQALIRKDSEDNKNVARRVDALETEVRNLDQYSRKDVVILTGMPLDDPDTETEEELVRKVLDTFHFVNPSLPLSYKDFSAIHRNGRKGKNGRPPSITVKFLRLHEKSKFMTLEAKRKFKVKNLNVFHAQAPRTIIEQDLIKNAENTEYVFYSGSVEHFVVKLECGHYLKYVRDFVDYGNKLNNHSCEWTNEVCGFIFCIPLIYFVL